MKWAAIKANMPGIRNSLNAGVYLILTAHNTSSDVSREAPEQSHNVTSREIGTTFLLRVFVQSFYPDLIW